MVFTIIIISVSVFVRFLSGPDSSDLAGGGGVRFRLKSDGCHACADFGGFSAQVNVDRLLEHVLVGRIVKLEVTYLASYSERELDGPQTEDGLCTAAPHQLDVLVADIVYELLT